MNIHRFINEKALCGVPSVKWLYCGIRIATEEGKEYTEAWCYGYHLKHSDNSVTSPFFTGLMHDSRLERIRRLAEVKKAEVKQLTLF